MKIFVLANSVWNIRTLRYDLINELKQEFSDVVTSHALTEKDISSLNFPDLNRNIRLKNIFKFALKSGRSLREENSVVLSFTFFANIIIGILFTFFVIKGKFVPTVTGLGQPYKIKILRIPYFFLSLVAYKRVSKIIFHNKKDAEVFIKLKIVPKRKVLIVNGSGVKKTSAYIKTNVSYPIKFGCISRAIPEKGLMELADAFCSSLLVQNKLLLVSDLLERNSVYINALQNKIHISKNIKILPSDYSKEKFFKQIDFFILNSEREGLSRSIIEAISYGVPVLCRDVPGCNNIVDDGRNGFLLKQHEDLSAKLIEISNINPHVWENLSSNSANSFKHYSAGCIAQKYKEVISFASGI